MLSNGKITTYKEKLAQANREAKATVIALIATVIAWIVLGFGLAGLDIEVFHTPLWVLGGTIGTWLFAIGVCIVLERFVFVDFDLDDEGADASLTPSYGAHLSGAQAVATHEAGVNHE